MTSKQIDFVLELAHTKNFNRAAENLYTSQPTMTYQIKAIEEEIGFPIFERSGKGASLTPAGMQFVTELRQIRQLLRNAIEQGQNMNSLYRDSLRVALPIRSAIYFLPEAIRRFSAAHPSVSVSLYFDWEHCLDSFLRRDQDVLFAMKHEVSRIPDIRLHPLFDSKIYLITERTDVLSKKKTVQSNDLAGRTLMVGGGSPPTLKKVQQRVIEEVGLSYFNSHDHDTTLTNVASGMGVCLAPGFLNDHNDEFAWIPFDCAEYIPCVLCTHKADRRKSLRDFVEILQSIYKAQNQFNF